MWSRPRGSLPAPWEEGPGSTVSRWSLGSSPDQGWLVNGRKYYYSPSVWMQSPVELALYRWWRSHPEQDELPEQDGLSAVPSSELPGWTCTSQPGAAMPVTDPVLCWHCPTGQGCQPSPWAKQQLHGPAHAGRSSRQGPPCSSPALGSRVVAINNQGCG